jgi:hypothetical protein
MLRLILVALLVGVGIWVGVKLASSPLGAVLSMSAATAAARPRRRSSDLLRIGSYDDDVLDRGRLARRVRQRRRHERRHP